MLAAIRGIHLRQFNIEVVNVIALDPGAEVSIRDVILRLASPHAVTATDALWQVDQHAPPVLAQLVIGGGLRSSGQNVFPGGAGGRQQEQEVTTGEVHFAPPAPLSVA